ncbi:MAG: sulfatase-like hydrolase/transferase [Gemmatimonadaceae bacterium]
MDSQLGRLFKELSAGELRNTLVIVTADHGEHFESAVWFDMRTACTRPWSACSLVIRFDGAVPRGARLVPVSLRDIGKTI